MWPGTLVFFFFEPNTLDLAYMSNSKHERTSKTWWDTIVFEPQLRTYTNFKPALRQMIMYWVICQDTSAHCYHNSEWGLYHCIVKQVDGLTLHSKKTL